MDSILYYWYDIRKGKRKIILLYLKKMKETPSYIKWLFTDHYFNNKQGIIKFLGTLMFISFAIIMPGPVLEEYNGGWIPIWPVIGSFIAVYGGLIGILLQPYGIYKRLKRLNWWDRIDHDLKK